MVTNVSAAEDQTTTSSSSSSSSSSVGVSADERVDQLKQQVNTFEEHFSSLIKDAFDARKELGILGAQQRLRDQIEEVAGAETASRADLMPHTTDTSIQADGSDTFEWDGTGEVPKDVTKVRIVDGLTSIENFALYKCSSLNSITIPNGVTSIGNSIFSGCTELTSITIPSKFRGQEERIGIPVGCTVTYN